MEQTTKHATILISIPTHEEQVEMYQDIEQTFKGMIFTVQSIGADLDRIFAE